MIFFLLFLCENNIKNNVAFSPHGAAGWSKSFLFPRKKIPGLLKRFLKSKHERLAKLISRHFMLTCASCSGNMPEVPEKITDYLKRKFWSSGFTSLCVKTHKFLRFGKTFCVPENMPEKRQAMEYLKKDSCNENTPEVPEFLKLLLRPKMIPALRTHLKFLSSLKSAFVPKRFLYFQNTPEFLKKKTSRCSCIENTPEVPEYLKRFLQRQQFIWNSSCIGNMPEIPKKFPVVLSCLKKSNFLSYWECSCGEIAPIDWVLSLAVW